jgi:hypothetical protein
MASFKLVEIDLPPDKEGTEGESEELRSVNPLEPWLGPFYVVDLELTEATKVNMPGDAELGMGAAPVWYRWLWSRR